MEDRHLWCDKCGRLRGGEKQKCLCPVQNAFAYICAPVVGVSMCSYVYVVDVSMCSCSRCVCVFM